MDGDQPHDQVRFLLTMIKNYGPTLGGWPNKTENPLRNRSRHLGRLVGDQLQSAHARHCGPTSDPQKAVVSVTGVTRVTRENYFSLSSKKGLRSSCSNRRMRAYLTPVNRPAATNQLERRLSKPVEKSPNKSGPPSKTTPVPRVLAARCGCYETPARGDPG
jgi:hypothetical protein